MKLSEINEHPYLTAWIGFVAILLLLALLITFIFSSFPAGEVLYFLAVFLIGYYLFREFVQHYILQKQGLELDQERKMDLVNQNPFLTAYLLLILISLIPTLCIGFLTAIIDNIIMANCYDFVSCFHNRNFSFVLTFLISLTLWVVINYFVFRLVVDRHILPLAIANPDEEVDLDN